MLLDATIYDGSGGPAVFTDIGISMGRIVAVGSLFAADAVRKILATGLAVAPGFIDSHAHTDLAYLSEDEPEVIAAGVKQGVTTQVSGNCGFSPFPAHERTLDPQDPYKGLFPQNLDSYFSTLREYKEQFTYASLPLNLAPLVGHGRVRSSVMNGDARPARKSEIEAMKYLAAQALDEGAFGVSTGLAYSPGCHAQMNELVEVASVLRRGNLPYVSHVRDEGDHSLAAIEEALKVGRESGARVHVSHHKVAGRRNWGLSARTLAMIETARASGIEVTLDFYPYTAGSTLLADILPPWALAGSPADMRGRLSDNSCRDALRKHFSEGLPGWQNFVGLSGWTNILLASSDWPERTSVAQAAEEKGCSEVDLVADVLLKDSSVLAIIEMMDPAEVDVIASVPYAMVGSDGIPMAGGAHPRLAGTFARLLASCGGDSFKLSQMVCRMTSLPASTFLIPNRGRIAVGYVADLVIFDPVSIQDRATYAQPLLGPIGVHHVLVNGQLVVDDGLLTAARPGKILEPAS